jgi:hypothetical protein
MTPTDKRIMRAIGFVLVVWFGVGVYGLLTIIGQLVGWMA